MLFVNVVLPVFCIVLAGFFLEKKQSLDFRTLTDLSLYLMTPALVFSALMKSPLPAIVGGRIALYMLFYTAALLLIGMVAARLCRFRGETRRALYLATAMMNVGNFGLPLAWFAYGEAGLDISVMTFVLFNIPLGTVAIMIAQNERTALWEAVGNTLRIPIFYAVVAAFSCQALALQPPEFILRALDLLGQGAIPLMLVLLGMQLGRSRVAADYTFLTVATTLRLFIAPIVGWVLASLLGFDGTARNVIVLQTSTPAAVLPLLYALRFDTRPDLVASAIFVTTLISAASLTLLLYLLP
jgi:predicted permease